jgi:hypothetical protein
MRRPDIEKTTEQIKARIMNLHQYGGKKPGRDLQLRGQFRWSGNEPAVIGQASTVLLVPLREAGIHLFKALGADAVRELRVGARPDI